MRRQLSCLIFCCGRQHFHKAWKSQSRLLKKFREIRRLYKPLPVFWFMAIQFIVCSLKIIVVLMIFKVMVGLFIVAHLCSMLWFLHSFGQVLYGIARIFVFQNDGCKTAADNLNGYFDIVVFNIATCITLGVVEVFNLKAMKAFQLLTLMLMILQPHHP